MPKPLVLVLTAEQRQELEALRDRGPVSYLRERAAALLKMAGGESGRQVALTGGLKRHHPDTVYEWYRRYQVDGVAGLRIRPGRGRKPSFSPSRGGSGSG